MNNTKNSIGINTFTVNNKTYKCWTVEFIRPYVIKFLKEKFPDSLMTFETNRIYIVVFDNRTDDIIPIEIQRIYASSKYGFSHAGFEDNIRRQLEDNIENYGVCWLFFDSEYLRFLQTKDIRQHGGISLNMNWLVKYMKEGKAKVFAIGYDGLAKELSSKDFDFLKDISQTCILGYENDERILNRNKLKIFRDTLRCHNFSQDDIDRVREYANDNKQNREKLEIFARKQKDKRIKLFGSILHATGRLPSINNFLDMNVDGHGQCMGGKWDASFIGIFDLYGDSHNATVRFVDRFNVCKYFPGYLRNKDKWDKLRGRNLTSRQLESIVTRKIDINKGIDYYWEK